MSDRDVFFSELAEDTQGQLGPQRDQDPENGIIDRLTPRDLPRKSRRERAAEARVKGGSTPLRDQAVRKLAEEIAGFFIVGPTSLSISETEARLRAFLAEQERELGAELRTQHEAFGKEFSALRGQLAALRGALEEILGFVCEWQHERSAKVVAQKAEAALAPGAGKAETEVLRAAVKWAAHETKARDANDDRVWSVADKSKEDLYGKLRTLRAARGGEETS